MHPFRFAVSLRVFSKSVEPTEIAAQLGLEPKWKHKIGEPRTTPKGVPLDGVYDSSYCSFPLIRLGEEELHEMLNRTADGLLPHKDLFCRIRDEGGCVEYFVGWYSKGNTGDKLSCSLLGKLGELQIDLALDIYGE